MKTKLTLLALSLTLPVLAAPPAGTWDSADGDFTAGDWAQALGQGEQGAVGNEWQLLGDSYQLGGALITATAVAETGADFVKTIATCSGGVLTLDNTGDAPWFVPSDPAASFTVTLSAMEVTTWTFLDDLGQPTGEQEFTLTASGTAGENPALAVTFEAGYSGQPERDETGVPTLLTGALDWATLTMTAPTVHVTVDIKPGSPVNPVNLTSRGLIPVAIMGSADFDVSLIDPATIRLEGIAPVRRSIGDLGLEDEEAGDGYADLKLKFKTPQLAAVLAGATRRETRTLTLTAKLFDGTAVEGSDTIRIVKANPPPKPVHKPHKPHKK